MPSAAVSDWSAEVADERNPSGYVTDSVLSRRSRGSGRGNRGGRGGMSYRDSGMLFSFVIVSDISQILIVFFFSFSF